jgi:hypothetical protein
VGNDVVVDREVASLAQTSFLYGVFFHLCHKKEKKKKRKG